MHESSGRIRLRSWKRAPNWCILEQEDAVYGLSVGWEMIGNATDLLPAWGHCQTPLQCLNQ